jgi:hypothetical protein
MDNPGFINMHSNLASRKGVKVGVVVEIEMGLNRCGILPGKPSVEFSKQIACSKGLMFEGVMGWEGYTAFIKDFEKRKDVNSCCAALIKITLYANDEQPYKDYRFLFSGLRDLTAAPACHISDSRISLSSAASFS